MEIIDPVSFNSIALSEVNCDTLKCQEGIERGRLLLLSMLSKYKSLRTLKQ
jgi:hypothetical protein